MPLSGKEMLKKFKKVGWVIKRQKGSHVFIQKGIKRETIPIHKELKKGLEKHLLKVLQES